MNKDIRLNKLLCAILLCVIVLANHSSIAVQAVCEKPRCYSVNSGEQFEVTTTVISEWEGYVNISLNIDNVGNNVIDNWYLTFRTPYAIIDIWDAYIFENDGNGTYTIKNNGYNQDIDVGSSVVLGMTLSLDGFEYTELSDIYLLNSAVSSVGEGDYNISYIEYSRWDGGYSGALIIKSNNYIEDWALSFKSEYEITSADNVCVDSVGDTYYIANNGYDQNLDGEYIIGIQGVQTENDFSLSEVCMTSVRLVYSLYDDYNKNGVCDYIEYIDSYSENGLSSVKPTIQPSNSPTNVPYFEEPTVALSIDELVYKSNSGIVESNVSIEILTEIGINSVWISEQNSEIIVEMNPVDETGKYGAVIKVDTNIETDTFEKVGYNVEYKFTDGTQYSTHFDVFIVLGSDETYFNSIYSRTYLFDYIDNGNFKVDDYETRKNTLIDILSELEGIGVVEPGSVYANEVGGNVCYRPTGDFFHYIEYKEYDSAFSSGSGVNTTRNTKVSDSAKLSDSEHYDLLIIDGFSDSDNRSGMYNALKNYFSGEDGNFIQDIKDEYKVELLKPLNVHIVNNPTLEDYMFDLDNGTFTILASHGTILYDSDISVCCTNICYDLSNASDSDIANQLLSEYVNKVWPVYRDVSNTEIELGLSAEFFKEFYGTERSLSDTIVLLDNCFSGYASDQGALVNAMSYCGAAAVSGYSSEVRSEYELNYDKECIKKICGGRYFLKAFHESASGIDEENQLLADYRNGKNQLPLYHVYHGTKLVDCINDIRHNIMFATLIPSITPTATPKPTSVISPTVHPTSGVSVTPTDKVIPTSPPIPVNEENDPIDVWFICESSDNFDEKKIEAYEEVLNYIFLSGKYFYGRDHIGVGYCTSSGTASTNYTHNGSDYYKNIIATVKGNYINGSGLLGIVISPIDWFLCSNWSNTINPRYEKLYNSRPDSYSMSNYVFFVDSNTRGYLDSRYTEEAIRCLCQNNVKVFWVNLGNGELPTDMIEFAEATGGGVLSSSPQQLWNELLSFQ